MQFIAIIFALAATAMAAPGSPDTGSYECTFGQYECAFNGESIKQCDIAGHWVEVGPCPDGTTCADSPDNGLPYCFADDASTKKTKKAKRDTDSHYCATPGTYSCTWNHQGINVCDSLNQIEFNGACPPKTHCELLASAGNIPFCVSNGW